MLVHTARDSATRLLDFFVAVPGLGLRADEAATPMEEVDVEFTGGGGGGHQGFPIGGPSCARPGGGARPAEGPAPFRALPGAGADAPGPPPPRGGGAAGRRGAGPAPPR